MANPDLILLHPPSLYDFRKLPGLHGPISDVVPSTPIFEMYPIGFASLSEYLERHGLKVRIVNVALKMLKDEGFDVERLYPSRILWPLVLTCTGWLMFRAPWHWQRSSRNITRIRLSS
jgi:hypothetical protein